MAEVERKALRPAEEAIRLADLIPVLKTWVPTPMVPKADAAIKVVAEEAKARFGKPFSGFKPEKGEIGCAILSPKDFNISTFRKEYATGWVDSPIVDFTTSKLTYIVILGYEDPESVIRASDLQFEISGAKQPVYHIEDMRKNEKHTQAVDPFFIRPNTPIDLDAKIEVAGWSELKPIGIVIATQPYLVSRTHLAG